MKPPHPYKESLEASWKEGIPANIMMGVMDYYLIPFALFLGANPQEVGLLVAFPHFLGSVSQLLASRVVRFIGSRLRLLILSALAQALLLIPAALLSLLPIPKKILILTIIASSFRILTNLIGTTWNSLMSDYLSPQERGRFFGWRAQVVSIAGIAGMVLAGVLLFFSRNVSEALGFCILFLGITGCRLLSAHLFVKMKDIGQEHKKENEFTFFMFLKRFRKSNFVKYVLYVAGITFATQLAAPYFSVYMLENLHFSYLQYMTVHLSSVVAGLISFPIWGYHADHVGNAKILKITGLIVPFIPLLWLLSDKVYYLVFVEALAGFVWGGFSLCAVNFIFDIVTPQKRVRCLSYFNFICGIALFFGATLGGYLADKLPPIKGHSILSLFIISGGLRFFFYFLLSGKFKEVRESVHPATGTQLFLSLLGIRAIIGRNRDWNFLTFIKKPF